MKASTVCFALAVCLATAVTGLAQDTDVPTPPPREHAVGDVPKTPIEQGPKVTAEEPGEPEPAIPTPEPATPEPAPAPVPEPVAPPPPPEPTPEPVTPPTPEPTPVPALPEPPVTTEVAPDMTGPKATVDRDIKDATEPAAAPVTAAVDIEPATSVRSDLSEVELVEKIAVARDTYRMALEALQMHYVEAHNAIKRQWVERELTELKAVDKYHYLNEVELAGPNLKPIASISAADQLFAEGMAFKDYPAFPEHKRSKLKIAVQKFRTIIADYPTSDKIDDAAFRMGEIYEGWYYKDYARAVICYERCFQWNPRTSSPARFYAARLYDQKLMLRDKAVTLYNLVIQESQNTQHIDEAMRRLKELTASK